MVDKQLHHSAYLALKAGKYDLAKKAFSELAAAGSPTAWTSLGWMYEHSAGVERSVRDAENCYGKAIALGDVPANFYLARLLVGQKDYRKAFTYFSAAADLGHVPSIYWLGRSYLTGRGVDRDVSKAERYLKDAMDKGHLYARRDYHRCRLGGAFGRRRLSDITGWMSALIGGSALALKDPNSDLLQ